LLQHAILVLADKIVRNVRLKGDLGFASTCHVDLATLPIVPAMP
jgi:hypothetical protein